MPDDSESSPAKSVILLDGRGADGDDKRASKQVKKIRKSAALIQTLEQKLAALAEKESDDNADEKTSGEDDSESAPKPCYRSPTSSGRVPKVPSTKSNLLTLLLPRVAVPGWQPTRNFLGLLIELKLECLERAFGKGQTVSELWQAAPHRDGSNRIMEASHSHDVRSISTYMAITMVNKELYELSRSFLRSHCFDVDDWDIATRRLEKLSLSSRYGDIRSFFFRSLEGLLDPTLFYDNSNIRRIGIGGLTSEHFQISKQKGGFQHHTHAYINYTVDTSGDFFTKLRQKCGRKNITYEFCANFLQAFDKHEESIRRHFLLGNSEIKPLSEKEIKDITEYHSGYFSSTLNWRERTKLVCAIGIMEGLVDRLCAFGEENLRHLMYMDKRLAEVNAD
ncbi:hypothetical protein BU16DRAFT_554063 [Lophium mytilinum]|uniref:Uncharacterized protein n=1 Tax=Lophium mytilinum TaxID=390894 RepID=A0A6A6RE37_9PEZI|nr:hypothetical protein BU16DRAFT_554063 [Lophium mytilinum]